MVSYEIHKQSIEIDISKVTLTACLGRFKRDSNLYFSEVKNFKALNGILRVRKFEFSI